MTAEISSVMDGEVKYEDAQHLFAATKTRPELMEAWQTYHLIGDCLRQQAPLSKDFALKVSERLAEEPTILAPPRRNVPSFDHPLIGLSAAASVAIITFAGWSAYQHADLQTPSAIQTASVAQGGQLVAMAQKPYPGFNSYLVAHRETSPSMGMEGVTPYIRAVADNQ